MGKQFVLASTALALTMTFATAAQAGGRTQDQSNAQQIQELNARVDELQTELQDTQLAAQKDRDALAAAQSKLSGWWSDTSISGRMYYDFTNIDNDHNGAADANNGFSFDFKRFYIGIDHKFNDIFSGNLTTDASFNSATGNAEVFVKKAYLQAKISDAFIVRAGSADMPWIPFAEEAYGYRYVEQTVVDRSKFGNSADWGVHVLGKLADGLVGYQVSVVDGAGYKNPVRTDGVDVEGRVNLNVDAFTLAVGGYYGHLGAKNNQPTFNEANRVNVLAAYNKDGIRIGAEYFMASDFSFVTTAGSSRATGYSGWASYQFDPQWSIFGKYEKVLPFDEFSTATAREEFENMYYNLGISWSPAKIVDFALVYKHDEGNNGFFTDGNGTIGGTAYAASNDGTYDEIGIFGQFRW